MKVMIERLLDGEHLTETEAEALLMTLTDASSSPVRAGAVLTALRAKGETPAEVRGFANAMRRLSIRPDIPAEIGGIDLVGTGGDGSQSVNLSTGAAILTAACGLPVVKHGNRSVSSDCGSADVLEALGYSMPENPAEVVEHLDRFGFTFLFAPYFHPAMKRMAPVRRDLRIRTVFNILGPLTNPAAPPYGVIGAFNLEVAQLMAETLAGMPIKRVFVVHDTGGWDEPTPIGPFHLFDVRPDEVRSERRDPADLGLPRCTAADLKGGDADFNARLLTMALNGSPGPVRNALALGASLALEVCGRAPSRDAALALAQNCIEGGDARKLLAAFQKERVRRQSGERQRV